MLFGGNMKNKINVLIVSLLLLIGFSETISQKVVHAVDTSRIHFEFRWNSPYDTSYRQQKWTKSGYNLKSNTVTVPFYKASAWGHSYRAGRTGEVDVSNWHVYMIKEHHTYNLYNLLVERYGTGNNAYIRAWSFSNGSAWGYWHADH